MTLLYVTLAILTLAIGAAMWFGRGVLRDHPIRVIAVVSVAAMAFFLGYMAIWLTDVLASPSWCAKAIQAEKISAQNFGGLTGCLDLLKIQLKSLATNSQIVIGSFSFGMVVLVVIVLAGGRASGKGPGGVEFDFGPALEAAAKAAATATAAAVTNGKPPAPPAAVPEPPAPTDATTGPHMPEPPKA